MKILLSLCIMTFAINVAYSQVTITGVSINFRTTSDDKDYDTGLQILVKTGNDILIASNSGQFGGFPNNTHYLLPLNLNNNNITQNQLPGTKISITIYPNGHDTWNFGFDLFINYSDGSEGSYSGDGYSLNQNNTNMVVPLGN